MSLSNVLKCGPHPFQIGLEGAHEKLCEKYIVFTFCTYCFPANNKNQNIYMSLLNILWAKIWSRQQSIEFFRIEFYRNYRIYRICRKLFLVVLKMILQNSVQKLNYYASSAGLSLTLVYSSTNMSKSVWTSGFWKALVHKNMSNFWNFILKILIIFSKSQNRSFLVKISLKTLPKRQKIAF